MAAPTRRRHERSRACLSSSRRSPAASARSSRSDCALPQQRAVRPERDGLILVVLCLVNDADALHDATTPAWRGQTPAPIIGLSLLAANGRPFPVTSIPGGVSCDGKTISTTSRAFEVSRKRRRGLSLGDPRRARRSRRAPRQGARREARAQRFMPLRLRAQISRPVACAPVASTAANASTMCGTERPGAAFPGCARLSAAERL
jgi:hypothetical protein